MILLILLQHTLTSSLCRKKQPHVHGRLELIGSSKRDRGGSCEIAMLLVEAVPPAEGAAPLEAAEMHVCSEGQQIDVLPFSTEPAPKPSVAADCQWQPRERPRNKLCSRRPISGKQRSTRAPAAPGTAGSRTCLQDYL